MVPSAAAAESLIDHDIVASPDSEGAYAAASKENSANCRLCFVEPEEVIPAKNGRTDNTGSKLTSTSNEKQRKRNNLG